MKKIISTFVFGILMLHISVFALNFQEQEHKIAELFESIKQSPSDSSTIAINKKIELAFLDFFQQTNSFHYTFSQVKYVGSIVSSDNVVRVLSWNYPLNHARTGYSAIILKANKSGKINTHLLSTYTPFKPVESKKYESAEWYGALYYRIITHKVSKKETEYILLGLSNYQSITKVKVIEPIKFTSKKLYLGLPLFTKNNRTLQRAVFEYKNEVNMHLEYDAKRRRFVFDHLSPSEPMYKGLFHFYGPDFSYDAFKWQKNRFIYEPDIDVRN